jgi:hypothetical protein
MEDEEIKVKGEKGSVSVKNEEIEMRVSSLGIRDSFEDNLNENYIGLEIEKSKDE